jgi:hypothetical protein
MKFPRDMLPGVLNLEPRTTAEITRQANQAAQHTREQEHEQNALLGLVLLIVGGLLIKPWLEDRRLF